MVATCQARSDARGGTYYRKKIAEASPVRRRCGASSGASAMPSSGASWRTRERIRAAPLDKEEPRTHPARSTVSRHERVTARAALVPSLKLLWSAEHGPL